MLGRGLFNILNILKVQLIWIGTSLDVSPHLLLLLNCLLSARSRRGVLYTYRTSYRALAPHAASLRLLSPARLIQILETFRTRVLSQRCPRDHRESSFISLYILRKNHCWARNIWLKTFDLSLRCSINFVIKNNTVRSREKCLLINSPRLFR